MWREVIKIGEFSSLTGLSIDTIRYYELEGLISPRRSAINQRIYGSEDIVWISFIKRLKQIGMSISDIKAYAYLRSLGEDTVGERLELLLSQRQALLSKIEASQRDLDFLDIKISTYLDTLGENHS